MGHALAGTETAILRAAGKPFADQIAMYGAAERFCEMAAGLTAGLVEGDVELVVLDGGDDE